MTDAVEMIKLQTKIVHEIKTRIMMLKADFDQEMSKKNREIISLRQASSVLEEEKKKLEELMQLKPMVAAMSADDTIHSGTSQIKKNQIKSRVPKLGDHVVCMWGQSKWQYFTATVVEYNVDEKQYTIDWDDNDPTGRVIDFANIALDEAPDESLIGIGTLVLFEQGKYRAQKWRM